MRGDKITAAVLAREEVLRYIRSTEGVTASEAQARIHAYLEELQTTQRYRMYRALQHPLYPILRKIDRRQQHVERARAAAAAGRRIIYASNHKSHIDYLVEPLVLDDNGVRPPVLTAGINLFGGALGLLHRHVTGAIPIRRGMKDPAYLATLKAYISELLQQRDLFLYLEGGRSYSGELKPFKTGALHAAAQARRTDAVVIPVAIAYDFVLEDLILARQRVKRRQRAFAVEVAEMVRYAVGYQSRAVVSFGQPVTLGDYDPDDRRSMLQLSRRLRSDIGRLHKILPTALVAAAMRPSIDRLALEARIDRLIDIIRAAGGDLDAESGAEAAERALAAMAARGIIVIQGDCLRIRQRNVIRYYSRSIQHLVSDRGHSSRTH